MQDNAKPLVHEPVRPLRKGFLREHVYAGRWRERMQRRSSALEKVLASYGWTVGQREANVAASVITWLGTNIGQPLACGSLSRWAPPSRTNGKASRTR